ncbi:50S ribosomal protein L1 [Patescibacteria group bacterium]|nr:50S ribosomal protein L1 [Patescibacteria group bacterium]
MKKAEKKEKRSKRYNKISEGLDINKIYTKEEAIAELKKISNAKFDESIEVHIRLGIDVKKTDQQVRTSINLPHGTGKTKKVMVFAEGNFADEAKEAGADFIGNEDTIDEILKNGVINFDIAIATPQMMPKIGKISRILGPKGIMPNPKIGTVTTEIKKAVESQKKGLVASFRNDKTGNVHQVIGKKSFEDSKLIENFDAFIEKLKSIKPEGVKKSYIKNVVLSSTMGPGIKVNVE